MPIIDSVKVDDIVDHICNNDDGWEDSEGNYWSVVETTEDGFYFHVEAPEGDKQTIFKFACIDSWTEVYK